MNAIPHLQWLAGELEANLALGVVYEELQVRMCVCVCVPGPNHKAPSSSKSPSRGERRAACDVFIMCMYNPL